MRNFSFGDPLPINFCISFISFRVAQPQKICEKPRKTRIAASMNVKIRLGIFKRLVGNL